MYAAQEGERLSAGFTLRFVRKGFLSGCLMANRGAVDILHS
jgi:hypothetical protein